MLVEGRRIAVLGATIAVAVGVGVWRVSDGSTIARATSYEPVGCPSSGHSKTVALDQLEARLPAPGPERPPLTRADIAVAVRAFVRDPRIQRIFDSAGFAPTTVRVTRENLTPPEPLAGPAHMAWVLATNPHHYLCVPGGQQTVLFNTDHVLTSDPRHYETYINPGAYLHASGVVAYVDLRTRRVVGVAGNTRDAVTEPPGYRAPAAVVRRVRDMSD